VDLYLINDRWWPSASAGGEQVSVQGPKKGDGDRFIRTRDKHREQLRSLNAKFLEI
jgi:hypothetical protein